MRIPANMAQMTDAERDNWRRSLTSKQWDDIANKEQTYKWVEWEVKEIARDEYGDATILDIFYWEDSLEAAQKEMARLFEQNPNNTFAIEKHVKHMCALSDGMVDDSYTFIGYAGDKILIDEWNGEL